jgi:hypothetical protein
LYVIAIVKHKQLQALTKIVVFQNFELLQRTRNRTSIHATATLAYSA